MAEIPAAEFDGHDFDAREVVQRYGNMPLTELQQGLQEHYKATRQELVELTVEGMKAVRNVMATGKAAWPTAWWVTGER